MKKELEELEECSLLNAHKDSLRATVKKISSFKTPGHDGVYKDSGLKISRPSTTDWSGN